MGLGLMFSGAGMLPRHYPLRVKGTELNWTELHGPGVSFGLGVASCLGVAFGAGFSHEGGL